MEGEVIRECLEAPHHGACLRVPMKMRSSQLSQVENVVITTSVTLFFDTLRTSQRTAAKPKSFPYTHPSIAHSYTLQSYAFVDQIVATSSDSADFGLFKKSPSLGKGGVGRWCRVQRSAWSAVFNWSPGEFRLRSLRQNCWLGFGCKTGPAAQKVDMSIFS